MAIKYTTPEVAKNTTSRDIEALAAQECKLQEKSVEYTDGDNIKFYTASTLMYCPLNADLSVYRVITEEQHKEYLELKEMSLKPKHIE